MITSDHEQETEDLKVESEIVYGDVFIQKENCVTTSKFVAHCNECEKNPMTDKYTCRFYEFRKIQFAIQDNTEKCIVAGFLDPDIDPSPEDLDLWTIYESRVTTDRQTADYILACVAAQFCELAAEELKVRKNEKQIAWKRSVHLVREICDVCDTSVFNFHWTCIHCGTSVCINCYKERDEKTSRWKPKTKADKDTRDNFFWLKCYNEKGHEMILTQMTTGNVLKCLNENLHKVCDSRNITQSCGCSLRTKNCLRVESKRMLLDLPPTSLQSTNADIRQLMKIKRYKNKISKVSLIEQNRLYQQVEHTNVSNSKILKILNPSESPDCYKLFQSEWEKEKPVVIANVTKNLNKLNWSPEYFSNRFGGEKHVMINCENGVSINRVAMKYFWDGFESIKKRLPRDCKEKLVLKLKDWPTSDDFSEVMREHFEDIMKAVPLSAYTNRNGKLNLARYLPAHFSRPDLGPKMYSAYSQTHPSKKGSTNLHLDVSDAVNVLVWVSKPVDSHLAPTQYSDEAIMKALVAAGADEADKKSLLDGTKLPGAIWHIFPAHKTDVMRKVLNHVAREKGKPLGVNDDPIHDQNWYIDEELRKKLSDEGVVSYTIVQYEGDAVFIPAGAPHQVLNVLDCIKVALDFVAPENLSECLNLTEEFRVLSTRHENREDRLQVKNILFHTIKNLIPVKRSS